MGESILAHKPWHFLFIIFFFLTLAYSSYALVQVTPALSNLTICSGNTFSVNITTSGVSNIYGFQCDLRYNSSVLSVVSVRQGNFLSNTTAYNTSWISPNLATAGLIANAACSRTGSGTVASPTSGSFAVITFSLQSGISYPATSTFVLGNLKLVDINNNDLSNASQNGQLRVPYCPCTNGQTRSCTTGNGCAGTQTCTGGVWGNCISSLNYCDSDCDGDSECFSGTCPSCQCYGYASRDCTTTEGCPGRQNCTGGVWDTICTLRYYYCDNDCNGVKETCSNYSCRVCNCTSGTTNSSGCVQLGVCSGSLKTCVNGAWSVCSKLPGVESCNGLDDDCDGSVDEVCNCTDGATKSCGSDVGECVSGLQTCVNGNWGSCIGSVGPVSEVCNNKDDNCDGTVDGLTSSSGCLQAGICQGSFQTCSGGVWSSCSKLPTTESCNGLDDDCDGSIDELFYNKEIGRGNV